LLAALAEFVAGVGMIVLLFTTFSAPQSRNQSVNDARNFPSLIDQLLYKLLVEVAKIACQFELSLHLIKRATCVPEKMPKLRIRQPSMPFGDIARHGNSRASNLTE